MEDSDQQAQANNINIVTKTGSLNSKQNECVDDVTQEMSGWLMKRTKISHKWKKQWFILKKTELHYGNTPENAVKLIRLQSADIAETNIDKKNNAFRIKPKEAKRTYYIYAEDESEQHNWMQAICFAKAASRTGEDSSACVLQ